MQKNKIHKDVYKFTIQCEPKTKKNSGRIIINRKTGKPQYIPSKEFKEYEKEAAVFVPRLHISTPVNVQAIYYRASKKRVDLTNLHEALHDLLVDCGCLEDDNANIIIGTDNSRVMIDRKNPRTEVTITPAKATFMDPEIKEKKNKESKKSKEAERKEEA